MNCCLIGVYDLTTSDIILFCITGAGGLNLQFVFVSACYSMQVGEAFVKAGVPHVVCVKVDTKVSVCRLLFVLHLVFMHLCMCHALKRLQLAHFPIRVKYSAIWLIGIHCLFTVVDSRCCGHCVHAGFLCRPTLRQDRQELLPHWYVVANICLLLCFG